MKIMKKIVLIAVIAAQVPLLDAAIRACGCQRPKPQQPVQPVEAPEASEESRHNEVMAAVEECCMMIKEEVQKVADPCVANPIKEAVAMAEAQEMMRSEGQSTESLQSEGTQPPILTKDCDEPKSPDMPNMPMQDMNDQSSEMMPSMDMPKTTKEMLSDCCIALAEKAVENCDMAALERVDAIMEKVEMIPEAR